MSCAAAASPGSGAAGSGPIIIGAILGPEDFAHYSALRRAHFPPDRTVLPAHLTLFRHLPPTLLAEVRQMLIVETQGVQPPGAVVSGVISLGRGVAFRVVSEELVAIRARLSSRFAYCLTPQDAAPWRAHITVQNKSTLCAAASLKASLEAGLRPRPLCLVGLAAFWYRGGPWELISRHHFSRR